MGASTESTSDMVKLCAPVAAAATDGLLASLSLNFGMASSSATDVFTAVYNSCGLSGIWTRKACPSLLLLRPLMWGTPSLHWQLLLLPPVQGRNQLRGHSDSWWQLGVIG